MLPWREGFMQGFCRRNRLSDVSKMDVVADGVCAVGQAAPLRRRQRVRRAKNWYCGIRLKARCMMRCWRRSTNSMPPIPGTSSSCPEYHGDTQQLGGELQAAVKAGTAPDLVIRNPSDVWALGDAVVPVQTYVNDKRFGLTPTDLKDIYPAMLDMARDPKDKTLLELSAGR